MKINYVLVYGTPYLKTAYFETFEDISKYLLKKSIVNYSIYEQMNDLKEVEMIHLENDVRVLEKENQSLKDRIEKTIEYIKESEGFDMYDEYVIFNKNHELQNILKGDK